MLFSCRFEPEIVLSGLQPGRVYGLSVRSLDRLGLRHPFGPATSCALGLIDQRVFIKYSFV